MTKKPLYFYQNQFVWQNWHEIWNQRLKIDPSTKFQLNPSKNRKVGQKLDFDPKNKEWRNYSGPVMTSSILLTFWIELVTYLHTTKFRFNWPSNNGNNEGGGIHPSPYLSDFSDPIPYRVKGGSFRIEPSGQLLDDRTHKKTTKGK